MRSTAANRVMEEASSSLSADFTNVDFAPPYFVLVLTSYRRFSLFLPNVTYHILEVTSCYYTMYVRTYFKQNLNKYRRDG